MIVEEARPGPMATIPMPHDTGVWCTSCGRYETTEPRAVTCEGCGCEAEAHQPAMVVPR